MSGRPLFAPMPNSMLMNVSLLMVCQPVLDSSLVMAEGCQYVISMHKCAWERMGDLLSAPNSL